ncbi:MAG: type I restriction system specificity protein [Bacteroidia bacterium]|nr:MAG: type I restriction system specificity protein [Bacteroidia bacterium]
MAGEWREVSLWDVADYINGRATKPSELCGERGVPVIKIAELNRGITDQTDRIPAVLVDDEHWVRDDDLLFAWSGSVGIYRYRGPRAALNQHIFKVIAKQGFDQGFVRYLLLSQLPVFQRHVEDKKTTMGHVTLRDLQRMMVRVPPLPEQRAIAHILGTLDDKIELNRRMSETLEQMARSLFKAWFVDFEPVRAKMEGRWQRGQSLPGLPAYLYDLFPDRLVNSELGEIPEGWEVGCVDDVFDLTMGQSPPGETYNEVGEGIPFYQGRADFTFRFPERRVYCTAPARFAKKGDTLISVRAPVGAINMALEDCAIGRGVAAARCKTGAKSYTYYFMQGLADVFSRFESEGTVFGSISKKDFHAVQCIIVPSKIVEAFEQLCEPIDDRIEAAFLESRTLAALRDALLPKLISGELRVREAERFLKERGL